MLADVCGEDKGDAELEICDANVLSGIDEQRWRIWRGDLVRAEGSARESESVMQRRGLEELMSRLQRSSEVEVR